MSVDIEKLDSLFASMDEDAVVAILVQPNPDPDCLGAAAGFRLLLSEKYGVKAKVFHNGDISHPQNKSMVNILHLKLGKGESFDEEKYAFTIVLDTDLAGTEFKSETLSSPSIRIDHHFMDRDGEPLLEDVRSVGSTCTLIWEWLKEAEISLEEHADVATGLVLGIKTDTAEFSSDNTTDLDFEAFRDLIQFVDRDRLAKLSAYPLPTSLFEHESKALDARVVKNSVLVSFVGTLVPQKRDEIPIIADRFMRMDGISTAIIMGIIEGNLVASVRSTDSTVNVSLLCEEVFGEEFSGAKEGCGGAKVPLAPLTLVEGMKLSEEANAVMESELFRHYTGKIFSCLGE